VAILVNQDTRVLIQGITGSVGRDFADRMLKHGTPLLAGVTPGKGGQDVYGVPVYNSVEQAVLEKRADCSLVVVPPSFIKDAVLEALDAGIKTLVIYAEGVPIHDAVYLVNYAKLKEARIVGPNTAGVMSPGKCNVSDINDESVSEGNIGIVSKSGTMTYEVMDGILQYNMGVSTVACLGGDPVIGTRYSEALRLFENDDETRAVVLLGEIGGTDEVEAAGYIKSMRKPVFAYVAGWAAPPGKKMGHAGAIICGEKHRARYKSEALRKGGAVTAETVNALIRILGANLKFSI
jgi:succinyl-CoA synthetase alpha subunit